MFIYRAKKLIFLIYFRCRLAPWVIGILLGQILLNAQNNNKTVILENTSYNRVNFILKTIFFWYHYFKVNFLNFFKDFKHFFVVYFGDRVGYRNIWWAWCFSEWSSNSTKPNRSGLLHNVFANNLVARPKLHYLCLRDVQRWIRKRFLVLVILGSTQSTLILCLSLSLFHCGHLYLYARSSYSYTVVYFRMLFKFNFTLKIYLLKIIIFF